MMLGIRKPRSREGTIKAVKGVAKGVVREEGREEDRGAGREEGKDDEMIVKE